MKTALTVSRFLFILFVLTLVACGGSDSGGGGTPPTNNPSSAATSSDNSASLSSQSSSTAVVIAAPQNVSVVAGNAQVTLTWNAVKGATGYRIYYAAEPNILIASIASFDDGTRLNNVNSPQVITELRNGETYYFVVTALQGDSESIASSEVSATPGAIDIAKQPTAQEVLVVELVNRARANPGAEAMRLGIGLNDGVTGTQITNTPKQPLAHNLFLIDSARRHSKWMLDEDIFSHTGISNSTPHERMQAAGYVFSGNWSSGENIAWGGTTGSNINLTNFAISHHEGLFKSPGHRVNILNETFRELGVGQLQGYFIQDGRNYLSSMLTQNFARSGSRSFLTGVIYEDKNNNEFYDVGEGLSGINFTINNTTYQVYNSGAYSIPLNNGIYELIITGDVLEAPVFHSVQISNQNRKLDVIKSGNGIRVFAP